MPTPTGAGRKRARIPNLLSGFRLLAAPVMLGLAWSGRPAAFLVLLAVSLATDAVDGFLARRLGWQSELGTRLDSWGDFATYASVPLGTWWLFPEILRREAFFVWLAICAYGLPVAAGFARWRRLTSCHTWAAKASAVVMSAGALLLFGWEIAWPLRLAAVFQALEAAEETMITCLLPARRSNVPSAWHAARIAADGPGGPGGGAR